MMKNTLFLLFAFCCLAMSTNGQVSLNEDVTTSSLTAEQIIDKYNSFEGAVRNMSRAEWEVMRAWDQYDEGEARRIVAEHKAATAEIRAERRQNGVYARQLAAGDCDCWVEPDETYTQINTTDWDETGGAGADVDAWLGPIGLNGWSHNHYGELFNSFYINSKGNCFVRCWLH